MAEPVPVLYVHHGQNWIRGSERCLLDLVAHLDRRRFHPIALCNADVLATQLRELAVPVYSGNGWVATESSFWPESRLVREVRRVVERHQVGLIHANIADTVKWLIPVARSAKIPILAHLHLPSTVDERCYGWLHQVSLVVGVSRAVVQEVLDDGLSASRVTVIYNGIDPVRLSAGDARALRAALGIPPRDVVLAAVGSLITRKGVDVLLAALALLRQQDPRHHLLLVGDGPERPALQALAASLGVEQAAHFLGERADVGAILRDATDIAVSASRQETLGLSLLEAALCGLPVVATAIPPHREAVLDQETGLLVPPEAPEPLARAIEVLSDDADRRRRLGAAGQRRVRKEFLVDRYVAQIQEAYESLLARPARVYGWLGEWCWPSVYWRWSAGWVGRRVTGLVTGGRARTDRSEGS